MDMWDEVDRTLIKVKIGERIQRRIAEYVPEDGREGD